MDFFPSLIIAIATFLAECITVSNVIIVLILTTVRGALSFQHFNSDTVVFSSKTNNYLVLHQVHHAIFLIELYPVKLLTLSSTNADLVTLLIIQPLTKRMNLRSNI